MKAYSGATSNYKYMLQRPKISYVILGVKLNFYTTFHWELFHFQCH